MIEQINSLLKLIIKYEDKYRQLKDNYKLNLKTTKEYEHLDIPPSLFPKTLPTKVVVTSSYSGDPINFILDFLVNVSSYFNYSNSGNTSINTEIKNINGNYTNVYFDYDSFLKNETEYSISSSSSSSSSYASVNTNANAYSSDKVYSISNTTITYDLSSFPLIVPIEEYTEFFDSSVITPNFNKKFYVLGTENLCAYVLNNINSYQKIMSDVITSLIILSYEPFVIYFLTAMYKMPISNLYYYFKNAKIDNINELDISKLKSEDVIKNIYDKLETIKNSSSLLNTIVGNLVNSLFDFFKDEVLNILIGESIISKTPEKIIDYIYTPVDNAKAFIQTNGLPKLCLFKTGTSRKKYIFDSGFVKIYEERVDIGGAPIIKRIRTSQDTTDAGRFGSNYLLTPFTRRIMIKNGFPVEIYIPCDNEINETINEISGVSEEKMLTLYLPISDWDDACLIGNMCCAFNQIIINNYYQRFKVEKCPTPEELLNLLNTVDYGSITIDCIKKVGEAKISWVSSG